MSTEFAFSQQAPPPQHFVDATSEVGRRYNDRMMMLANQFLYNKVPPTKLEAAIIQTRMDPALFQVEKQEHRIEALIALFKGIKAQELSDAIFGKAWQEILESQPTVSPHEPKPPETLTREEVAREFKWFGLREKMVEEEQKALTAYQKFLELNKGRGIPVTEGIELQSSDIEVLVVDLETRIAERITDPDERRARQLELNRQLLGIIDRLGARESGKRDELIELYMLRRLIQSADMGHLASVSHGTPRKDLDRHKAVDLWITAAGMKIDVQLKTLRSGVGSEQLAKQDALLEKTDRNLAGSSTHWRVLETKAVRNAFLDARKEREDAPTSLKDKLDVFKPLTHDIEPAVSARLITVLGLTPERCKQEQLAYETHQQVLAEQQKVLDERQRVFEAHRATIRAKEQEDEAKRKVFQAEYDAMVAQAAAEREREMQVAAEKAARALELQRQDAEASRKVREEQIARELAKREEAEAKVLALREAQKKREEADRRAEERLRKKLEAPDWPPKTTAELGTIRALTTLGFLTSEQAKNTKDTRPMLAAKAEYAKLFAKPKPHFGKVFRTREEFDAPTPEVLERLRILRAANAA